MLASVDAQIGSICPADTDSALPFPGPRVGIIRSLAGVHLPARPRAAQRRAVRLVRGRWEVPAAGASAAGPGPSDCGLAVMRHDTQDRLQVIGRVGAELKGDGHVPGRTGDDQLMEVAVADDEVA